MLAPAARINDSIFHDPQNFTPNKKTFNSHREASKLVINVSTRYGRREIDFIARAKNVLFMQILTNWLCIAKAS